MKYMAEFEGIKLTQNEINNIEIMDIFYETEFSNNKTGSSIRIDAKVFFDDNEKKSNKIIKSIYEIINKIFDVKLVIDEINLVYRQMYIKSINQKYLNSSGILIITLSQSYIGDKKGMIINDKN